MITVLHLSDVHWHPGNDGNVGVVLEALLSDLRQQNAEREHKVDLIAFTGDLVMAGENRDHFDAAFNAVIKPILKSLDLGTDRFVICPGNHDMARQVVRDTQILEDGIKANLISVDSVNTFIDRISSAGSRSLPFIERSNNYNNFVDTLDLGEVLNHPLVRAYKFDIRGTSVGVAALHTAWRATGEADDVDRNKLLLGERNVDDALTALPECDLMLALFHHPTNWLSDFDAAAVAPRLYSGFDALLYGHAHNIEPELRKTVTGSSVMSQSGSFFESRSYYNGYQIIEFDPSTCEAALTLRTYFDKPARRFGPAENIVPGGMIQLAYDARKGGERAEIERALRELRPTIRDAALEQFNIADLGADFRPDPHAVFICPPLDSHRSGSQASAPDQAPDDEASEKNIPTTATPELTAEMLLREAGNCLLVGSRESGKTSLAHYMSVLCAEGASDKSRIPAVIDYRTLRANQYGIRKSAAAYLGPVKSGLDFDEALSAGDFLFLVDNFDGRDKVKKAALKKLMDQFPGCRWVLFADSRVGGTDATQVDSDVVGDPTIAYIRTLPRKSIRELTRRWCDQTGGDGDKTYTALMHQLKQSGLPRTGYIVTLLLWAMYQNKRMERINEAVLLTNMVDFLLGKADFTKALRKEFDPTSKEITLQHLASFIRGHDGVAPINEATQFLIDFFKQKGLAYDAGAFVEALVDAGILSKDDLVLKFKYRCFQDYFAASLLRNDTSALAEVLDGRNYLFFTRELELLSGLRRQNGDVINILLREIEANAPLSLSTIAVEDYDKIVEQESGIGAAPHRIAQIRKKRLTADQVDDLLDAADRKLAERADEDDLPASEEGGDESEDLSQYEPEQQLSQSRDTKSELRPFAYVTSVHLLGRVTRNSEFDDATLKIQSARQYLRHTSKIYLKFVTIYNEVLADLSDDLSKNSSSITDEEIAAIRFQLTKWFMMSTSENVSDQFGSEKFIPIYNELYDDSSLSKIERTILTMLMIDVNFPDWELHWKDFASKSKNERFTLEILVEKLWDHIHTRTVSPQQQQRIESVVDTVERSLGMPKHAKSEMLQSLRKSVKDADKE